MGILRGNFAIRDDFLRALQQQPRLTAAMAFSLRRNPLGKPVAAVRPSVAVGVIYVEKAGQGLPVIDIHGYLGVVSAEAATARAAAAAEGSKCEAMAACCW